MRDHLNSTSHGHRPALASNIDGREVLDPEVIRPLDRPSARMARWRC
jgi:hypothetical protein